MKTFVMCLLILAFASFAHAVKPGTCTDVPISWYFEPVTTNDLPAAIYNDDRGVYREGVDGVFNSKIHYCGYGSHDATLGLNRSKVRTLNIRFSLISGTDIDGQLPSFAGQTISSKPFLNIRNITAFGYNVGTTYYTKMTMGYIKDPVQRNVEYGLAFLPYDWQCPIGLSCVDSPTSDTADAKQNDPVPAAWVKVTYMPRDLGQQWSSSNTDQWIVEGEFTTATDPEIQRGTLLSAGVHMGQYSMPFRIRITALAPLP